RPYRAARQPRPRFEHRTQPRERERLLHIERQRRRAEEQHADEDEQRREEGQPLPGQRGWQEGHGCASLAGPAAPATLSAVLASSGRAPVPPTMTVPFARVFCM